MLANERTFIEGRAAQLELHKVCATRSCGVDVQLRASFG